jgi:hypothetical protein
MHAVSLTPDAQYNFRTTSENHMQNGDAMQKKLKIYSVSMTPHARVHSGLLTPHSRCMRGQ